jgi:BetR domain
MEHNNVQQVLLFQQIKALLPPHLSVADEIARVLGISTDSAYRRIRGEKSISFEDLCKLGACYNLSIDQFLQLQTSGFIFTGTLGYSHDDFVGQYLNNMLQQFEFICSFDHKHIYFLPIDIPPFAYFQFPELAAFTFYYYRKSLLRFDEMKDLKFSVNDLNDDHVRLGKKVQRSYNKIPTTEIWGIDTINSILRHISFYRDTHVFKSREDIICLYEKLEELITHIEKQAKLGLKFNYGELPDKDSASYRMFHNDLINGDNCVLAEVGDIKITYINHNVINFMFTRNEKFNNHTLETFQNAMQKSAQISLVSEKKRAGFFDRLRKKILAHKEANSHY